MCIICVIVFGFFGDVGIVIVRYIGFISVIEVVRWFGVININSIVMGGRDIGLCVLFRFLEFLVSVLVWFLEF